MSSSKLVEAIGVFASLRVAKFDMARVETLLANPNLEELEVLDLNEVVRDSLPLLLEKFKERGDTINFCSTYDDESAVVSQKRSDSVDRSTYDDMKNIDSQGEEDATSADARTSADATYLPSSFEYYSGAVVCGFKDKKTLPLKRKQKVVAKEISKTVFRELFPTKEVTETILPGSFPDMSDFDGGIEFVGEGFSGMVFKSTLNDIPVVLKVSKTKSEASNRADYHEWSISEKLKPHPNVLRVMGLCPSFSHEKFKKAAGTTAIISPWQENRGLSHFYEHRDHQENDVQNIALGMIQGIRSLHDQGAIHRDIALRNFLVNEDGRVLLCDFGLTEFIPEGHNSLNPQNWTESASLPWRSLAPESFNGEFSTKSDIWMYGLALIELVNGEHPWVEFKNATAFKKALRSKSIKSPNLKAFDPIMAEIVVGCCQFDPINRPTADDIAEKLVKWQFREQHENRDENGNTVLHQCVTLSSRKQFRALLDDSKTSVMINSVNNYDETPLMLASDPYIRSRILKHLKIPRCHREPSKDPAYFINVDVFVTLLKLAHRGDTEGVNALNCPGIENFSREMYLHRGDKNGETPLHISAKSGNGSLVTAILALNLVNANKQNDDGQTALHVASLHGHATVVEKLLYREKGLAEEDVAEDSPYVDVNVQDKLGKTALHLAASGGHAKVVAALLNHHKIEANLSDEDRRAPIFESFCASGEVDVFGGSRKRTAILELFLNHEKIDLSVKDSGEMSIMHEIARINSLEAAKLVIQHPQFDKFQDDHKESKYPLLHVAVRELSFDIVNLLLSTNVVDVMQQDKHGNTALHVLAEIELSKFNTDMHMKALKQSNKLEIVSLLISHPDVDIKRCNSRGNTALHAASKVDNHILAKILLIHSEIDVNAKNAILKTPLHFAAERNSVHVAAVLLAQDGVQVNAQTLNRVSPLAWAAEKDAAEVAAMLLKHKDVDVNDRNKWERTPLHVAVKYSSVRVAKMLIAREDVDADAKDDKHQTALHFAARSDLVEVATLLLARADVDPNACDVKLRTPLHYTVSFKDGVGVAKLLLARGDVDITATDSDGNTALQVAESKRFTECADLLREMQIVCHARLRTLLAQNDAPPPQCNNCAPRFERFESCL